MCGLLCAATQEKGEPQPLPILDPGPFPAWSPQPSYLRTAPCGHSQARGMCVGGGWWPAQVRGVQASWRVRPSVSSSTSPQKPGRTGPSGFSATTQWALTTASLHTGTEGAGGPVRDGARWGEAQGKQSAGRGGAQPARLLPPRSVQGRLPGRALPMDPVWGTWGVFFSPLHFPSSVTMSLTTRWLSCRNGTTKALVLCSGGPKVMTRGVSRWRCSPPAWPLPPSSPTARSLPVSPP